MTPPINRVLSLILASAIIVVFADVRFSHSSALNENFCVTNDYKEIASYAAKKTPENISGPSCAYRLAVGPVFKKISLGPSRGDEEAGEKLIAWNDKESISNLSPNCGRRAVSSPGC